MALLIKDIINFTGSVEDNAIRSSVYAEIFKAFNLDFIISISFTGQQIAISLNLYFFRFKL